MSVSESSSLSSPPSSDGEEEPTKTKIIAKTLKLKGGKLTAAPVDGSPLSSPEPVPPPREPTPPHEYVLADNPDIAFLVMFRSRFNEVFPKNVPNLGPQDIENGVVGSVPSEQIENFLCALLGLILNRKKYVERGHHGRALEEAISSQKHQWPTIWGGQNPLPGTRTFSDMDPTERLSLLKTLVLWALNASEVISSIMRESYKQIRHDDDLNQPRSVQPWGNDGRKRRYWLIEGQNDTPFRLYKENDPKLVHRTWWSVAGNLDELKAVGEGLRAEKSQAGRRLADSITAAIPRLEETLEKRKRKEYRIARRAQFSRPEPGFSLYEGRTRGKRMKYTFSDDEDTSDVNSIRRSTRQSNRSTPAEFGGPTVTSSGRQVRSRFGRSYGDIQPQSSEAENWNQSEMTRHASGRPRRSTANDFQQSTRSGSHTDDEMSDDNDDPPSSGEEWDGNDDDVEGKFDGEDDEISDDASDDSLMDHPGSLIVTLKYKKNVPIVLDSGLNGVAHAGPKPPEDVLITSIAHRPQHLSMQAPETTPSDPMPSASPDATMRVSKNQNGNPAPEYHQESDWHPVKPETPSLLQSIPSHSPPPFPEVAPPESSASSHYPPASKFVWQPPSATASRSDQQSSVQDIGLQNSHALPPPAPAYISRHLSEQVPPPSPAALPPQHQVHFNGSPRMAHEPYTTFNRPDHTQEQQQNQTGTQVGMNPFLTHPHETPPANLR